LFTELLPLLAGRTVLITVAKADDKTLCVNIIPVLGKADENLALIPPLTYTGSPEELDADLGKHLAGYVQTHQQTASTLAETKATLEAAAKAAQEEAKRKAEERKKAAEKAATTSASGAGPAPVTLTTEVPPASSSASTLVLFPTTPAEPARTQTKGGLAL
jgi:PRTRC genetic system protein E